MREITLFHQGFFTMNAPLECIAHGSGNDWQAICLDLDIAVQAQSLHEVTRILQESVSTYIQDAMEQDEPTRTQMLNRSVPFSVRAVWAIRLFMATLFRRRLDLNHKEDKRETTVGFPVECPAKVYFPRIYSNSGSGEIPSRPHGSYASSLRRHCGRRHKKRDRSIPQCERRNQAGYARFDDPPVWPSEASFS
jgi:hypothetical protein